MKSTNTPEPHQASLAPVMETAPINWEVNIISIDKLGIDFNMLLNNGWIEIIIYED